MCYPLRCLRDKQINAYREMHINIKAKSNKLMDDNCIKRFIFYVFIIDVKYRNTPKN